MSRARCGANARRCPRAWTALGSPAHFANQVTQPARANSLARWGELLASPASHTETCDSASAGRCAVQCVHDVTFRFGRGVAFVCEGPARGQRGRHRPTHQPSEAQRERTTFEAAVRGAVGGVRSAGIDS